MRIGPFFTWRGETPRGTGIRTHILARRCVECKRIIWRASLLHPRWNANRARASYHHGCMEAMIARKWPELPCFICNRALA